MEPMKPKQNHKATGEQSEAILIAKLLEVGYAILTPFGDNRYYHTRAGRATHGSKNYKDQIDYFAVYCPENREAYLIPVAHAGISQMNLRLVPTKNKQEQGVKWAEDYKL